MWYVAAWRDLIRDEYFPLKNNLMIGEKIAGPLSRSIDPSIPLNSPYGYDSQYFWALSVDPNLQDTLMLNTLGNKTYRSQRILLPYLTHIIIRNPINILYGLWFWACIGVLLGAIGLYRLCVYFKISPVLPLICFIGSPGLFITTIHPMSDGLASGLILLGLSFWMNKRFYTSTIFFALACLAREASVFIILLLIFYSLFIDQKKWALRLVPLLLSIIPFVVWQIHLYHLFGSLDTVKSVNYDIPFAGTIKTFSTYLNLRVNREDLFVSILIHTTCLFAWIRWAKHWRDDLIYLLLTHALFITICSKAVMEDNYSSCRISILYSVFLIMAIMYQTKKVEVSNLST